MDDIVKNKDVVINLAALIGIPYSYKSVESYVDTNVKGTMNLLNSSKKFRIKKFIQTSTSEVYGTANIFQLMKSIHCQVNLRTLLQKLLQIN